MHFRATLLSLAGLSLIGFGCGSQNAAADEGQQNPALAEKALARVERGTCNLAGIPAFLQTKLSVEEQEDLRVEVERWLRDVGNLWVVPRAGVLFAKSADDSGADPPHPTFVKAQSQHACGIEARWLADATRVSMNQHAAYGAPIICQDNVCCYAALGEYDSAGGLVLSRTAPHSWQIRAVYEVADNGTLLEDRIAADYELVRQQLRKFEGRECKNEPVHPGG